MLLPRAPEKFLAFRAVSDNRAALEAILSLYADSVATYSSVGVADARQSAAASGGRCSPNSVDTLGVPTVGEKQLMLRSLKRAAVTS